MKNLKRLVLTTSALLILAVSSPTFSQTPDGVTPAGENVCDPLTDATPGLYGLCVAYCEAHDADLFSPGGNLEELKMPDQRILANYNRKKKETDPAMPCVLDESGDDPLEECPCWTAVQLEEMMPPTANFDYNLPNACKASASSSVLENYENGDDGRVFQLAIYAFEGCAVSNASGVSGGPPSGFASLTSEEENACMTLLANHARKYSITGIVWDCFD